MNPREEWIALASTEGVGEETFSALVSAFGSAGATLRAVRDGRFDAWFQQRRAEDGRVPMVKPAVANLRATAADPGQRLKAIADLGLWTFTATDADYPARLHDLANPPFVIHGLGEKSALVRRGSSLLSARGGQRRRAALSPRRCVPASWNAARPWSPASRLVSTARPTPRPWNTSGTTIGVIGGGHRFPGPRAHTRLRDEIVASGGAVISEHHPDSHPTKGTFPRRNRIIAALSDAVIVIEAPHRSGALNTAHHALALSRPVFVAPGRIGDWSMAGALALLRDTPARPLVGLDELVQDLGYFDSPTAAGESQTRDIARRGAGDARTQRARRRLTSV